MPMAKPLKRHPALVPLSQDHHFGLLLSWKIRQGLNKDIDSSRIFKYVDYFVNAHLEVHFQNEEQYLFTYLTKNDLLRKGAENQHENLRQLFQTMKNASTVGEDELREYADCLEGHIRFEERKLFPYIQVELLDGDLEEFQAKMDMVHERVKENWEDEFWLKK